jgi:mannose-6-phosphate isomerase-like protein (cupin superfamily)
MHISATDAYQKLATSGNLFLELFQHGSLSVEIYKPAEKDLQQPHNKDELYVVISGSGEFLMDNQLVSFQTGDFLFVPAGMEHRFLNYTNDFSTWVFFYGPVGGEK